MRDREPSALRRKASRWGHVSLAPGTGTRNGTAEHANETSSSAAAPASSARMSQASSAGALLVPAPCRLS